MGHSLGISDWYYRATDTELLEDYLNIRFLTIDDGNRLQENSIARTETRHIGLMKLQYAQQMNAMRDEVREEMKLQIKTLINQLKPEIVNEGLL